MTIKLVEPAPGSSQDRRRGERRLDFGNAWDYAPAPETPDHVRLQKRYELFIDGKTAFLRDGPWVWGAVEKAPAETKPQLKVAGLPFPVEPGGASNSIHIAAKIGQ